VTSTHKTDHAHTSAFSLQSKRKIKNKRHVYYGKIFGQLQNNHFDETA
jgi:hypothetical protein